MGRGGAVLLDGMIRRRLVLVGMDMGVAAARVAVYQEAWGRRRERG